MINEKLGKNTFDIINITINDNDINTRNWVDSAQDRDWRIFMNAALNLQVP